MRGPPRRRIPRRDQGDRARQRLRDRGEAGEHRHRAAPFRGEEEVSRPALAAVLDAKAKTPPELEARAETTFSEIEKLAKANNVDELIGKFRELRVIADDYPAAGPGVLAAKLAQWRDRLEPYKEVLLVVWLQVS